MSNLCHEVYIDAHGIVQNVMFRQTIIRAAQKLGLEAGATNNNSNKSSCNITLKGSENKINELISKIKDTKILNSWGAQVSSLQLLPKGIPIDKHSVTTANVDDFNWKSDVEFYI